MGTTTAKNWRCRSAILGALNCARPTNPSFARWLGGWKAGPRLCLVPWVWILLSAVPARSAQNYFLDPRSGSIEFSVTHLGVFVSHGTFRRFWTTLRLDQAHPERSRVRLDIDARSLVIPWPGWTRRLLSPAYFDVQDHPDIRFRSTAISAEASQHYVVHGLLEIRGVTRPITLHAVLVDREYDQTEGVEVAEFVAFGRLKRSSFGMTADMFLISDDVELAVRARLEVKDTSPLGWGVWSEGRAPS